MIIYNKKHKYWVGHKISFLLAKGIDYNKATANDDWQICVQEDEDGHHVPLFGFITVIKAIPLKIRLQLLFQFYSEMLHLFPLCAAILAFLFYFFMVEDKPANILSAITGFIVVFWYVDTLTPRKKF